MKHLAAFLLIVGCAHTPEVPRPTSDTHLQGVPHVPQTANQCGASALASVLRFFGEEVGLADLEPYLYTPEKEGTLGLELMASARRYGYLAIPVRTPERLQASLRRGYPVIVLQNLSFAWLPQWHFAVVTGAGPESLTMTSGRYAEKNTNWSTFLTTWQRAKRWGVAVIPAQQAWVDRKEHMAAAFALEQTEQQPAALTAYRTATRAWPDQPQAWMARGNLAYELARWPEAQQSFRAVVSLAPDNADGWNNLAYAYRQTGQQTLAKSAIERALALAPGDPNIAASHAELTH